MCAAKEGGRARHGHRGRLASMIPRWLVILRQGPRNVSVKSQLVAVFRFWSPRVPVATIQLCSWSRKDTPCINGCDCPPVTFYLPKQVVGLSSEDPLISTNAYQTLQKEVHFRYAHSLVPSAAGTVGQGLGQRLQGAAPSSYPSVLHTHYALLAVPYCE